MPDPDPAAYEAYVDATAATIGLPIDPAHRPGVLRYFALAASMAEQVMSVPLGIADEPAEHFVPIASEELVAPAVEAATPAEARHDG